MKKVIKKGEVKRVGQEEKWIDSFLEETIAKKSDVTKMKEVFIMYSQFLLKFIRNEIDLEQLKKVELTTAKIFFSKLAISDLSLTESQKINQGKRSIIYNLQNGTILKEESIIPEPNSSIQDKEINLFHVFKESFIQFYLYHAIQPTIVPNLLFVKMKNQHTQIRMEKIDGISFYQFMINNIQDEKKIIQKLIDLSILLNQLQDSFGFVHGDLHCKNIMITKDDKIVLIDFGLSCITLHDDSKPFVMSVVQHDSKLMYIPDNAQNYSKSLDLFYMFVGIYRYIYENEFPESSTLLPLIQFLFQIPHTQLNLMTLLFDYIKKYEKEDVYTYIHRITRHIHIVVKFLIQYHKKDSSIPFISKKSILQIRKRFEPSSFQKSLQHYLHKKTPYVTKNVSNSNFI